MARSNLRGNYNNPNSVIPWHRPRDPEMLGIPGSRGRCRGMTVEESSLLLNYVQCKHASKLNLLKAGFTLIEVLIALAVLAIALVALIRANADNINHSAYLENKTVASWVAMDIAREVRLGLKRLPINSTPLYGRMRMLDKVWDWQLYRLSDRKEGVIAFKVKVNLNGQTASVLKGSIYVSR